MNYSSLLSLKTPNYIFIFKMKYFKYIDFISHNVSLEINNSGKFRSFQGSLLSFVNLVVIIVLTAFFGRELYERKLPSVISATKFKPESRMHIKDFQHSMIFWNEDASLIKNPLNYFRARIHILEFEKSEFIQSQYDDNIKFVNCEKRHFSSWIGTVDDIVLENHLKFSPFCFDYPEDYYFLNTRDETSFKQITYDITICDPSVESCPDDLEQVVKKAFLGFYLRDNYIDETDYESPINYNIATLLNKFIYGSTKEIIFDVSKTYFQTDDGWLLESLSLQESSKISKILTETTPPSKDYPNSLMWIILASPRLGTTYQRRYMKIQDLLAKIGGLINAMIIISKLFFYHYLRYLYNLYKNKIVYRIICERNNVNVKDINESNQDLKKSEVEAENNKVILNENRIKQPFVKVEESQDKKIDNKGTIVNYPQIKGSTPVKLIAPSNKLQKNDYSLSTIYTYYKMKYFEIMKAMICRNKENLVRKKKFERLSDEVVQLKSYIKLLDLPSVVSDCEQKAEAEIYPIKNQK